MPSRAQIMLMAVKLKFRKETVEDMILVSCDPAEESFISIFCGGGGKVGREGREE